MHPNPSLVEMTLKEAIDVIAARAAERRTRPATYQEKIALEASNVLGAVGDYIKNNDTAKGALLGAGTGALAGTGAALAAPGGWKEKRKRLTSNLLGGGLAGAAIGGGLGAAKQYGGALKSPGGGPSGTAGKPGTFTDPDTGKPVTIDPRILKDRPDLADQVQKLNTPSVETRISQGVGGAVGGAFTYAPATSTAGTFILGNEARKAAYGSGAEFTRKNMMAGLQDKDLTARIGKADALKDLGERVSYADQEKLVGKAKGGSLFGRAFKTPNMDEVLHSHKGQDLTRGNLRDILSKGHAETRIGMGKLPVVTGRNAALLGTAAAIDLGRHAYIGQRDQDQQRQQLRELMSQVAKETAARGRK